MMAVEKAFVELPVSVRSKPVLVDMVISAVDSKKNVSFGAYWVKDLADRYVHLPRDVYKIVPMLHYDNANKIEVQYYVFDRYILGIMKGKLGSCSCYIKPYSGSHLVITLANGQVPQIQFRELSLDEIPTSFRNPGKLIQEMKMTCVSYPEQELMKGE